MLSLFRSPRVIGHVSGVANTVRHGYASGWHDKRTTTDPIITTFTTTPITKTNSTIIERGRGTSISVKRWNQNKSPKPWQKSSKKRAMTWRQSEIKSGSKVVRVCDILFIGISNRLESMGRRIFKERKSHWNRNPVKKGVNAAGPITRNPNKWGEKHFIDIASIFCAHEYSGAY